MDGTVPTKPVVRLSRRGFLRLTLGAAIAAGLGVIYKKTEAIGFGNWLRWMVRGQQERFSASARVGLAPCPSYDSDILAALRLAWKEAMAPDLGGARVVLKPNLVDYIEGRPCFTNPLVVDALIEYLLGEVHVGSVVVAEGTTFRRDTESLLSSTGFADLLSKHNVDFVDLNYDDLVPVPLKGNYTNLRRLFLAKTVVEADALISVPKLKTHHWTQVSGSIKNLFGIVPGVKYGWPKNTLHIKGIPAFLAELLESLPTPIRLAVVDGIVGMQGDGPLFGTPVPVGALVVGSDFLAVDATCARLIGIEPAGIDYLAFAAWAGLGQVDEARIQISGATIDSLKQRFQPAPSLG